MRHSALENIIFKEYVREFKASMLRSRSFFGSIFMTFSIYFMLCYKFTNCPTIGLKAIGSFCSVKDYIIFKKYVRVRSFIHAPFLGVFLCFAISLRTGFISFFIIFEATFNLPYIDYFEVMDNIIFKKFVQEFEASLTRLFWEYFYAGL